MPHRLFLLTTLFVLGALCVGVAQAQNPVDLSIFIDQNSLTVFVPGVGVTSINGFGMSTQIGSQVSAVDLNSYPAFAPLPFATLPAPVCLRVEIGAAAQPLACQGVTVVTQQLALADRFWWDTSTAQSRTLIITQGGNAVGICPAGQPRCDVSYTPLPPSSLTATPEPVVVAPPTQGVTPTPTHTLEEPYVTIMSVVGNVRSGDGEEHNTLWQLQENDSAAIIGRNVEATWYLIEMNDMRGWVAGHIVAVTGNPSSVPIVDPQIVISPTPPTTTYPVISPQNVTQLTEIAVLQHDDWVNAVAFSPDGSLIASGSDEGLVHLWNVDTFQSMNTLSNPFNDADVLDIAFSRDAALLIAGNERGVANVWSVADGETVENLLLLSTFVDAVAFSPTGDFAAIGAGDNFLRLLDPVQNQMIPLSPSHDSAITDLSYKSDGTALASATTGGVLHIWDTASRSSVNMPVIFEGGANAVAFSPDGSLVAGAGEDGVLRLMEFPSLTLAAELSGHTDAIYAIAFSPDGSLIATASRDNTVTLWDVANREQLASIPPMQGLSGQINDVAFSPDGTLLAYAGVDSRVHVWAVR